MRRLVFTLPLFFGASANAPIALKFSTELSPVLSKVIGDYPNYFSHIKGDTVEKTPQVTNYACLLTMKGMQPGIISQFGDEKDHVYSWQNVLCEAENFEDAKKKF